MKTLLRNFMTLVRRFKMAVALSVIGLSVAFAVFIAIMIQVKFERDFDKCHSKLSNIYRFEYLVGDDIFNAILPRPVVDAMISSSPNIVAGTIINPFIGKCYISVMNNGNKVGFKEPFVGCYPGITEVFDFKMADGSADCLKEKGKVLIPKSMAQRFFSNESAINQRLDLMSGIWSVKDSGYLTIGGVYFDFPENTQLDNSIYVTMSDKYAVTDWDSSNYYCYVLLNNEADPNDITKNFDRNFDWTKLNRGVDFKSESKLTPFRNLYYMDDNMDGTIKSNSRTTGRVLISVAILILLVACVNFTNFSMALTPMRVKNINIQKVLGRSVKSLRIGMVFESVLLSLISFVISLVIIGLLRELNLVSFLKADLSLVDNMDIVLITGGISVALGVLAGLYPSFYVTSFPPALVLKGYFGLSPVGRALRTGLLFFQFFVSCLLIICATFIYLQNRYMLHYDLGYDKDNVVVVEMTRYFMRKNKMAYESKLKESPYIDDVAYSWQKLGSQENYMQMGVDYKDGTIPFKVLPVSWNFFDVMGMKKIGDWKLTEGDDKGGIKFIVSNDAKTYYDMREGDVLNFGWDTNAHPIVGCVGEACFTSLKINMGYVLYSVGDYPNKPISYIRLAKGCDVVSAINHIKKTISGLDSVYPARIEFYDSFFDALYRDEVNISSIISFMSLIAIIISLVGVFGLVLFESQFRRKEIGIRKVMGSTVGEVLALLGKKYILLVVFSFVFSIPVGIYCVTLYFERFVSKVPLYWWVFALAFVMIMAVTMFTVVYQSWKTATMNPCESITSE